MSWGILVVYGEAMPTKLGTCTACLGPIYNVEGPADACGCDTGVLTTLYLREGTTARTPVTVAAGRPRQPNRNGDELPGLDITMFMSPSARAEMAGAQMYATSMTMTYPEDSGVIVEDMDVAFDRVLPLGDGLDISFEPSEMADIPQAFPERSSRFRVDHGLPRREPFQGRVASGQSDGEIVGRVGQRGIPVPVREIGQDRPVDYIIGQREDRGSDWDRPSLQTLLADQRRAAQQAPRPVSRPLESRPVDRSKIPTALERLGSIDIDDDPFR